MVNYCCIELSIKIEWMKILIVDSQISYQEGVANFLNQHLNSVEIICAKEGRRALQLAVLHEFDLIITSLNLPILSGFELIREIRKHKPSLFIMVLTSYCNQSILNKLKELNIQAFIMKYVSLSEILNAIKCMKHDELYFSKEHLEKSENSLVSKDGEFLSDDVFSKIYELSNREVEVLHLMIENLSNDKIAKTLFLSIETIKTHRKNIFRKLRVNNLLDLYKQLVQANYI